MAHFRLFLRIALHSRPGAATARVSVASSIAHVPIVHASRKACAYVVCRVTAAHSYGRFPVAYAIAVSGARARASAARDLLRFRPPFR